MKKILSFTLSVILLLTTIIVAVPVTAASADALCATPITDWVLNTNSLATETETYPLGYVNATGVEMTADSAIEATTVSTSSVFSRVSWLNEDDSKKTISFADATYFMMYVELEAGNTILPQIHCDLGFATYDPAVTLKKDSKYSYMAVGDTAWTPADSVYCGAGEEGEYGYGIKFDEAFKGYIKFNLYDLLGGDCGYNSTRAISEIRVYFKGIGGDYGSAVTGPFFLITEDSNSTNIVIPDSFKPTPIQATPLEWDSVASPNGSVGVTTTTMPLGYTTAQGIICNQGWNYSSRYTVSDVRFWYVFGESQTVDEILLYVNIPQENSLKIILCESDGNPWDTIIAKSRYEYAALTDASWSKGYVSENNSIEFNDAFNGYIKLNRSSNFNNTQGFTHFAVYLDGVGVSTASISTTIDYGNPVIGPIFEITKDSNSTEIEVPAAYQPQPIQATPLEYNSVLSAPGTVNVSSTKLPLNYTTAAGIVCQTNKSYPQKYDTINQIRFYFAYSQVISPDDMLIYLNLPKGNEVKFILSGTTDKFDYPWNSLKANTNYEYATITDTSWTSGTVTSSGTIKFPDGFEGYLKLNRNVNFGNTSGFAYISVYFEGIGTGYLSDGTTYVDYGNPVVGPIFEISEDSNSTEIEVPAAYQPKPIQVTAITDWYHNNYADFEAAGLAGGTWSTYTEAPLDFTSAIGDSLKLSNNTVYEFDPVSNSAIRTYVTLNNGLDLTVAESLIVYVNIPAENTLLFTFKTDTDGAYPRSMTLKSDGTGTYYLAEKGGTGWTEKTAEYCGDTTASNQTYTGGIKLDSAFEGYIKIPVTSLGCADETLVNVKKGLALLMNIECKFEGLTDKYGNNAVVGPYFMATTDSTSTELNLNNLEGDVNIDSFVNAKDMGAIRQYLVGNNNNYLTAKGQNVVGVAAEQIAAGGNVNGDANGVDICDLVYMSRIADDIIFSNKTYYKTASSGINGEIRTISAYVYMPDNNIKASACGGVVLGNYGLAGNCLNFEIYRNGKPRIYSVNGLGEGIDLIFNGDIRTGDYAHLVLSIDDVNKTAACYINGALVEELSFTNDFDLTLNELQYMLGGDYRTNNSNYIKGKLGEVALFSSTLTSDDVAAIYSNSTAANSDNLVAIWDVKNARESYYIEDESNNGNHLNPYTTFFYNEAEDIDRAYSFAVVGDTQSLASSYSGKFGAIYDWILANKEEKNIQHVFGLGDIVDNDTSESQWETAVNGINKMNGKISYSLVRGNHDSNENMNKYFANEAYMSQIDGFYKEGDVNNVYQLFEVGNTKYLFMTLEYLHDTDDGSTGTNPGQPLTPEEQDDIIAWAKGVIDANPDRKVIISTHYYINADGSITGVNDIETEIVAKCPNVLLVLGGHISSDTIVQGTTNTYEVNGESYKVTSLLVDPQDTDLSYNGLGLVAMLYFSEDGKTIEVEYYSTVRNQYFLRDNQFVITVE